MTHRVLMLLVTLAAAIAVGSGIAKGDEFVMPFTGDLYLQQMGGEAGGVTQFGVGTSPTNFSVLLRLAQ